MPMLSTRCRPRRHDACGVGCLPQAERRNPSHDLVQRDRAWAAALVVTGIVVFFN